ncbi:MAG: adenosylcobinamide-GDP ribazoletransferase [Candidatus Omnitrophica bacterium]|nr:adenosylcobinamide-GDP ribazoletransferase [Candidatus Omnitrophota bacterium]
MVSFLLAVQFLTTIPVGSKSAVNKKQLKISLYFYALVGSFIGFILGCIGYGALFLSQSLAAVMVVICGVLLTGGLHIDGFADSCDGLYGQRTIENRLSIMRDSRIGAMGVMGITCILMFKYVLILNISSVFILPSLICMGAFSRFSLIYAGYLSQYARKEGKAKFFFNSIGKKALWINGVITAFLLFICFQIKGLLVLGASLIFVTGAIKYVEKKINGMTGDTIGAINEVAEICVLLGCYGIGKF